MAFLAQSEKEKEEQQQGGGPAPVNQESTSQGKTLSAPGAMSSSGSGNKQQGPAKGTSSGSFTNLNNYITANEGNDTAMGKKIRSNVDQQANEAQTLGSTFQDTAKDVTEQATVKLDEGALNDFNKDVVAFTGGTRNVGGQDVSNKDVFSGQINATYVGPNAANEITGYQNTKDAYGNVDKSVQMATEGGIEGRSGLLQNAYNRPDYTRGQQTLDSFILGAGTGGMQAIKDMGEAYSGFGGQFAAVASDVDKMIGDARRTTDLTRETWRQAYGGQHDTVWDNIDAAADQAALTNEQNQALRTQAWEALSNVDEFSKLVGGLDKTTVNWLKNHTKNMEPHQVREFLGQVYNQGGTALTGNFVDDSTQQKYGALSGLLGLIEDNSGYRNDAVDFTKGDANAYSINDRLQVMKDVAAADAAIERARQQYGSDVAQVNEMLAGDERGFTNPHEMLLMDRAGMSRAEANAVLNYLKSKNDSIANYVNVASPDQLGTGDYAKLAGMDPQTYSAIRGLLGITDPIQTKNNAGYTVNTKALNKVLQGLYGEPSQGGITMPGQLAIQVNNTGAPALSNYNPAYIKRLLDEARDPIQKPTTTSTRYSDIDPNNPIAGLFY